MKAEHEFYFSGDLSWQPTDEPGVFRLILSKDDFDPRILTSLTRWEPGVDTSAAGVISHDYFEECYLLEGDLHDLTLDRKFAPGYYTSRPPGMHHGPYRTKSGCLMLEIRSRPDAHYDGSIR